MLRAFLNILLVSYIFRLSFLNIAVFAAVINRMQLTMYHCRQHYIEQSEVSRQAVGNKDGE